MISPRSMRTYPLKSHLCLASTGLGLSLRRWQARLSGCIPLVAAPLLILTMARGLEAQPDQDRTETENSETENSEAQADHTPEEGAQEAVGTANNGDAARRETELVGMLSLLRYLEVQQELQLSDDQRDAIEHLIEVRVREGASQVALPTLAFAAESERLGMQWLSLGQREALAQLYFAQVGLEALDRSDVRLVLRLSAAQVKAVEKLVAERNAAIAASSPFRGRILRSQYERRLHAVLDNTQQAQWERIAGLAVSTPRDAGEAASEIANGAQDHTPLPKDERSKGGAGDTTTAEGMPAKSGVGGSAPIGPPPEAATLEFAFERTPWREVLNWLAEKADLSLYVGVLPTGSLTYSDTRLYSPDEAIERINRFLLPQGYTLVRSGKMLTAISLEDGRRDQLLDRLAEFATLAELDQRRDNEVVKCIFTLAKADPQQALAEIAPLVSISTPVLMAKSRQLLVIETAEKLRLIRMTLEAMESADTQSNSVRQFTLKHARADDVLDSVRPLVGLSNDTNVSEQISISASPDGSQVFGTGTADKLTIMETAVNLLDAPPEKLPPSAKPFLKAHPVPGSLQAAEDVLHTLLAGEKGVRVAQEPETKQIIVLGNQEVHDQVEQTIAKLGTKSGNVFDVITLRETDTFAAMSVLRELLDIPYVSDKEDEKEGDYPRIDWDPRSQRIFVRGTQDQVDEVRTILERLENPDSQEGDERLHILPAYGEEAEQLLEMAKRFWPGDESVEIHERARRQDDDIMERTIRDDVRRDGPTPKSAPRSRDLPPGGDRGDDAESNVLPETESDNESRETRFPTNARSDRGTRYVAAQREADPIKADIQAQVTPRGILIHADDPELIQRFEEHIRRVAGPGGISETKMAIFYLTFVTATEAKAMLAEIRFGKPYEYGSSSRTSSRSSGGARYSPPSIIADSRLNRLIVQGTIPEIEKIERHLKLIDRDEGLADIQFRGKAVFLQLHHIPAAEAARMIREAYATQLVGATEAQAQANQQQQQQQAQQAAQQAAAATTGASETEKSNDSESKSGKESDAGGKDDKKAKDAGPSPPMSTGSSQRAQTVEPKLALSIDSINNGLILRAPMPLVREIAELLKIIDRKATQTTEVLSVDGVSAEELQRILRGTLGPNAPTVNQQQPQRQNQPQPQPNRQPAANGNDVFQTLILPGS